MSLFRQNRRFIAWFACLAILLNSLAPAISHAMASMQGEEAPWTQICSTSGNKFIPLDLGKFSKQDGDKQPQPMAMEHCAYCLTHAGSFAVFSDVPLQFTPDRLTHTYPALFYQSPYPLFSWAVASPRAPPVLL
jgi:hypothetical protein